MGRVDRQEAAAHDGRIADRLDALAEVADLMGDEDGATRLRSAAAERRMRAMRLLDE